ncbi:Homeobox-leucine zipper protein HAT22 [Heracleum sosnowskyi]|uniref:Homeobox-leucine zipper protein HAT22 n=1 Tax=Heracleum sosnowskyi TaxID=360622 RepID=A0AAD8MC38_9APIA|nr:Homeobox-leucine zipper protein HAT22 [Heracleum sosnowskyi]
MGDEEMGLGLGLSIGMGNEYVPKRDLQKNKRVANVCLDLSLPLCSEEEAKEAMNSEYGKADGSISSSETCKFGDCSDDTENKNCSNKKLRLTAQQTSLLEDSFNMSNTLNKVQKEALAERLNLRPRQVEVWFQNRRARTKLKQTEVDYAFLKKCCESLSDENRRLKKELQELPSLKVQQPPPPLYIQLPKATTLAMCPSCEKLVQVGGDPDEEDANKTIASIANKHEGHKH